VCVSRVCCYCALVLTVRIAGFARSVCLSVCPVQAVNSITKKRRKTKMCVNVEQGRSNQCANIYFRRSNVKVAQLYGDGRTICLQWVDIFFLV